MLQIPQNHIHTRSTPFWNKETAPAGIFERHLDKGTRAGVYQFGVFPPEKWHNIEVMTDDTYFNIDFFVAPEVLMESANQRKVVRTGKE